MKFLIGDHVKVVDNESLDGYKIGDTAFVGGELFGNVVILMEKDAMPQLVDGSDIKLIADDDDAFFSTAAKSDGKKIIAIVIDGRTVTVSDGNNKAVAKCSPEDSFDEATGVKLAVDRFYEPKKFPQDGDEFFFADCDGTVESEVFCDAEYQKRMVERGNCFKSREEAAGLAKKFREVMEKH